MEKPAARQENPRHPQEARGTPAHAPSARRGRGPWRVAEGVVSANRAGFGFVRVEGQEESVFLPPPQMAGVMHGDRVRVSVERGRDGRYSGPPGKNPRTCHQGIRRHARSSWAHGLRDRGRPAHRMRCLVPPDELGGARHGDWVIAAVTRYAGPGATPQARIIDVSTPKSRWSSPAKRPSRASICRENFRPRRFARRNRYGNEVDPAEAARRVDLRDLPLVTIDGEDAKDFDDAVYAEPHAEGFPAHRRDRRCELLRAPRNGARCQCA